MDFLYLIRSDFATGFTRVCCGPFQKILPVVKNSVHTPQEIAAGRRGKNGIRPGDPLGSQEPLGLME